MACGNNQISRDYLSTPPSSQSPLQEIRARLPSDAGNDRLKADVWSTRSGSFQDRPGVSRSHSGVDSRGEGRWDFKPDPGVGKRAYTHMTGKAGWLGPRSLLASLPEAVRKDLAGRQVIVLGKDPNQRWTNERATKFDSMGRVQKTVVRRSR
jgi:hypothetical protein